MKRSSAAGILAVCLLWVAAPVHAQDGSTCSLWAMRGTYAFSATAWQDLSVMNPSLPKGYAPVSIVGAFAVNAGGELTGWATVNAGGIPMTVEFVDSRVSTPKADCRVAMTFSMKIKEYGDVIDGPYSYTGVIAGDPSSLEIVFMMLGTGPGSHVELARAKRISMRPEAGSPQDQRLPAAQLIVPSIVIGAGVPASRAMKSLNRPPSSPPPVAPANRPDPPAKLK
jgi:hypothetical protein